MATATILLVQSAEARGSATRTYLSSIGYDVIWTGSGMSALAAVGKHPVSLAIVDASLPDMEGEDLCRRLRSRDDTRSVPILLLTNSGQSFAVPAAQGEGPDVRLAKPFTAGDLNAKIAMAIRRSAELAASRDRQPARPEAAPDRRSVEPSEPAEEAVVDPETGLFGRKQFDVMLSKEFKRAVRYRQHMSCLLISLGGGELERTADPSVIRAIVGLIQRTIREVDTAAWWTGEALMVMLPNTECHDAMQAAMRVLETVANHPFTWPDSARVTVNIGVAGLPDEHIETEQELIEAAAEACRRAGATLLPKLSGAKGRTENAK